MSTILKFNDEARASLLKGINIVADAVGSTLGPKGRNVAKGQFPRPVVVHDGVTVARWIDLKDPFEKVGADLLKDAAIKTNEKAGDGTTTSTILAQAIINEAFKAIGSGANPQTIKSGIEDALKVVLEELAKLAKKVTTDEEIEQVATISSADPVLGKLIAEAVKKVGMDGVVTIEEGNSFETSVEYKQGMEIDRGYISPYFVTDQDRVEAVVENPYILLTDLKISHNFELLPFVEKFFEGGTRKELVIFASDVNDEALSTLVVNKLRGGFNLLAVQAPAFGGRRIDELEDMAILTGGKVITNDSGRELGSVMIEELGRADKIVSDRDKTTILGAKGAPEAIKRQMETLKAQITVANTDYDRDIKKQRLAKLAGGVAVINVGAATEVEMKEKKERIIDAVNATKAAIEEGIVAGGEITLTHLVKVVRPSDEFFSGENILAAALMAPLYVLMNNSGYDFINIVKALRKTEYPFGIDATDGAIKDLIKAGIIDPVKVTRCALENAVSVAVMALTTDTLIVDEMEVK